MKLPENLGSAVYNGAKTIAKYTGVFATGAVVGTVGTCLYIADILMPGIEAAKANAKMTIRHNLTPEEARGTIQSPLLERLELGQGNNENKGNEYNPENDPVMDYIIGFQKRLEEQGKEFDRQAKGLGETIDELDKALEEAEKLERQYEAEEQGYQRNEDKGEKKSPSRGAEIPTPERAYKRQPSAVESPQKMYEQLLELDQYIGRATKRMNQTTLNMERAARAGRMDEAKEYLDQFVEDQKDFSEKVEEATGLLDKANEELGTSFNGAEELIKMQEDLNEQLGMLEDMLERGR